MAQSRHGAMSAQSPLSGVKRKFELRAVRSAFDPSRTLSRLDDHGLLVTNISCSSGTIINGGC